MVQLGLMADPTDAPNLIEYVYNPDLDDHEFITPLENSAVAEFEILRLKTILNDPKLDRVKTEFERAANEFLEKSTVGYTTEQVELRNAVLDFYAFTLFEPDVTKVPSTVQRSDQQGFFLHPKFYSEQSGLGHLVVPYLNEFLDTLGYEAVESYQSIVHNMGFDAHKKKELHQIAEPYIKQDPLYVFINSLGLQLNDDEQALSDNDRLIELANEARRTKQRMNIKEGEPTDYLTDRKINRAVVRRDIQLDEVRVMAKANGRSAKESYFDGLAQLVKERAMENLAKSYGFDKRDLVAEYDLDAQYHNRHNNLFISHRPSNTIFRLAIHEEDLSKSILARIFKVEGEHTPMRLDFDRVMADGLHRFNPQNTLMVNFQILLPGRRVALLEDVVYSTTIVAMHRQKAIISKLNETAEHGDYTNMPSPFEEIFDAWFMNRRLQLQEITNGVYENNASISESSNILSKETLDRHKRANVAFVSIQDPNPILATTLVMRSQIDISDLSSDYQGDSDLSLNFFQEYLKDGHVPLVYGYILVGQKDGYFLYKQDPSYSKNINIGIDLSNKATSKVLESLTQEFFQMGAYELAQKFEILLERQDELTMDELAEIIKDGCNYSFDAKYEMGNVDKIADYACSVEDGRLQVQCTGSNTLFKLIAQKLDPEINIELISGKVLSHGERSVEGTGHAMIRVSSKSGMQLVDATPIEMQRVLSPKNNAFTLESHSERVVLFMNGDNSSTDRFKELVVARTGDLEKFIDRISRSSRKPTDSVAAYLKGRERRVTHDPISKAYRAMRGLEGMVLGKNTVETEDGKNFVREFTSSLAFLETYNGNDFFKRNRNVKPVDPRIVDCLIGIMKPIAQTIEASPHLANAHSLNKAIVSNQVGTDNLVR